MFRGNLQTSALVNGVGGGVGDDWRLLSCLLWLCVGGLCAPRADVQGDQAVDVDQPVEVAEADHGEDPAEVEWVAAEVRNNLDDLGEEDPGTKVAESIGLGLSASHGLVQAVKEESINNKSRALELSNVDEVQADDMAVPPVISGRHDQVVTRPMAASPAGSLVEEAGPVILKGGYDEGLGVALESNIPSLVEGPAGEVLVISVRCHEVVVELVVLDDGSAVKASSTREGGNSAVKVVGGHGVEVSTLQIANSEKVDQAGEAPGV